MLHKICEIVYYMKYANICLIDENCKPVTSVKCANLPGIVLLISCMFFIIKQVITRMQKKSIIKWRCTNLLTSILYTPWYVAESYSWVAYGFDQRWWKTCYTNGYLISLNYNISANRQSLQEIDFSREITSTIKHN